MMSISTRVNELVVMRSIIGRFSLGGRVLFPVPSQCVAGLNASVGMEVVRKILEEARYRVVDVPTVQALMEPLVNVERIHSAL